ncbi:MAG: glycosyltransferase [Chlorobiaceae bacterium]
MNILFINSIGRDKFGGGEKWMVNAAKGLVKRGHVVVLGSKKNSKILEYATSRGINTAVFEIHSDISLFGTINIAAWLKKHDIDILICNLNKDVRVAGLAARLIKKPVVLARHGIRLCGKKWTHKLALTKLTDGVITNSTTIKEAYAGYGWFDNQFVNVIYNGVEIPEQVTPYNFSERFPGKKIIYSAGRLSEQKGFTFLIEAASLLKKTRDDLVFAVSGEGKLENELKKLVSSKGLDHAFIFLGFTKDIFPYLKGCDLFVLASLFEGMPNVVMEAMAMKKPVIATDVNGARELIIDSKTGLIVPPKSPQAIADAITALIDNSDLLQKFGEAGYDRVNREFTMKAMVNNLELFLQQKLREKNGF